MCAEEIQANACSGPSSRHTERISDAVASRLVAGALRFRIPTSYAKPHDTVAAVGCNINAKNNQGP